MKLVWHTGLQFSIIPLIVSRSVGWVRAGGSVLVDLGWSWGIMVHDWLFPRISLYACHSEDLFDKLQTAPLSLNARTIMYSSSKISR